MMEGKQTGVENSDFKAMLTINSDGTLKWNQTDGLNVGTLRSGTWKLDGNILTLKWSSPKGGQITWISSSVTGDEIADGTYTAEHVSGGTWAASRSIQSGTEKEAAIYQEKHLGDDNKKNPSSFTPNQGDFLKAVKDDLRKIGSKASKKTLENLSKYISEGRVTFSNEKEDRVGDASVDGSRLGSSLNKLIINQVPVDQWHQYESGYDMAQQKKDLGMEKKFSINEKMSSLGMAFSLIHEDVHMGRYLPDQTPEYENEAYEAQISEERNLINENMQKIREIHDRGANLPGDQDKLTELITDLTVSCNVYEVYTQNMEAEVIAKGYVDRDRFKTAVADMEKLVKEGRELIKSINQNVSDPCSGMAEPIRHLVGCD
jgi:hypothetical protein